MTKDPFADIPWPDPAQPSPQTSGAIRDAVAKDLEPRPGMAANTRLLLSIAISVVVVVAAVLAMAPPDGHVGGVLYGALGWGAVQATVLYLGLARPPGRRSSRRARFALLGAVALGFFVYLGFAANHSLAFTEFLGGAGHRHSAVMCALHAIGFGAVASGAVLLLFYRTDPLSPALSGAVAGLAGGLAGAVAIGMTCPSGESWHLWLGHGAVLVGFVAAGWLLGRKSLAP